MTIETVTAFKDNAGKLHATRQLAERENALATVKTVMQLAGTPDMHSFLAVLKKHSNNAEFSNAIKSYFQTFEPETENDKRLSFDFYGTAFETFEEAVKSNYKRFINNGVYGKLSPNFKSFDLDGNMQPSLEEWEKANDRISADNGYQFFNYMGFEHETILGAIADNRDMPAEVKSKKGPFFDLWGNQHNTFKQAKNANLQ